MSDAYRVSLGGAINPTVIRAFEMGHSLKIAMALMVASLALGTPIFGSERSLMVSYGPAHCLPIGLGYLAKWNLLVHDVYFGYGPAIAKGKIRDAVVGHLGIGVAF